MEDLVAMENIIVAASNFPCIYPISLAYKNRDFLTTGIVTYVASASVVSHLFENHKHGMPGFLKIMGISSSQKLSYILNRLDVLGAFLTMGRFGYLYYEKYGLTSDFFFDNPCYTAWLLSTFGLLFISEYDKFNPKLKRIYIFTHCLWHMSVFPLMGFSYKIFTS
jgi:hypothetical protein